MLETNNSLAFLLVILGDSGLFISHNVALWVAYLLFSDDGLHMICIFDYVGLYFSNISSCGISSHVDYIFLYLNNVPLFVFGDVSVHNILPISEYFLLFFVLMDITLLILIALLLVSDNSSVF
jgi:hypothetical protein